jgi:hypothetical protein
MIKTDFKGVARELNRIQRKIAKMEDIATTRTLNRILGEERREIASDVSDEYGVLKSSAKSHITPVKATRVNKEIKLNVHSVRTNLPSPKQIKGGVSFRKKGGGRAKIKVNIDGGSKPFVIKVKAGGKAGAEEIKTRGTVKKAAVFVPEEFNKLKNTITKNGKNIIRRKVKTLFGSSLAKMVDTMEIKSKDLRKAVRDKFPSIFKKELGRAKFTGGK